VIEAVLFATIFGKMELFWAFCRFGMAFVRERLFERLGQVPVAILARRLAIKLTVSVPAVTEPGGVMGDDSV
jgi:hypothetical protein